MRRFLRGTTYDWLSRIEGRKPLGDKPLFLMAASPGERGGQSVLAAATSRFPRDGSNILATFSLPSFNSNFDNGVITNEAIDDDFVNTVEIVREYFI